MKVSPSLYSSNSDALQTITLVKNTLAEYIHIDIKNIFKEKIDNVKKDVSMIRKNSELKIDMHVIDKSPELWEKDIIDLNPDYIAFQYENIESMDRFLIFKEKIKKLCFVGIAITPKTNFNQIENIIKQFDYVLLMTTIPGESGGKFNGESLKWIKSFKNLYPSIRVHVDGGVNKQVADKLKSINIDVLVSGSYIMSAKSMISSVLALKGLDDNTLVKKYMLDSKYVPTIKKNMTILEALSVIEKSQRGFCFVGFQPNTWGIVTDGDIRRFYISKNKILNRSVKECANFDPFTINVNCTLKDLNEKIISAKFNKKLKFVIVTNYNKPVGIIDLKKI